MTFPSPSRPRINTVSSSLPLLLLGGIFLHAVKVLSALGAIVFVQDYHGSRRPLFTRLYNHCRLAIECSINHSGDWRNIRFHSATSAGGRGADVCGASRRAVSQCTGLGVLDRAGDMVRPNAARKVQR